MAFLFPKLFPPYVGCLPETPNGDIEMALEDAMALVWKAKKLKLTVSYTATALYTFEGEGGTLINTLNGDTKIFLSKDNGSAQPLEKMSDIMCDDIYETIFEDGTNFFGGTFFGDFSFGGNGDEGQVQFENDLFPFGPVSVRTVGGTQVCDFQYGLFLDPRGLNIYPNFMVSTGAPAQEGDGVVYATVPNGAVIMVNGNTYSTDLYFKPDSTFAEFGVVFDSATATGQILVEIESERLAE
jgi:hypothetical protein